MAKIKLPRKLKKQITKGCIFNSNLEGKRFKSMRIVSIDFEARTYGQRIVAVEQKYKHNGKE